MKLGIFVTHPIQYFAPIWRMLAATPGLEVVVHFFSDHSVRGGLDEGFGVDVAWDVPLLEGYSHRFISHDADLSRHSSVRLPDPKKYLRDGGFDAVMIHGYTHGFERQVTSAARSLGIKTLMRGEFIDALPYGGRNILKRWIRDDYLRRFYRRIDAFCYIGEEARRHLIAHRVAEQKMYLSPYSVDSELFEKQRARFDRRAVRGEFGIADDSLAILFSGKLIPRKAPLLLIEAIRKLGDAGKIHLIVVGDGELSRQVEAAGRAVLGSRLLMPGFVNQSALGRYYSAADLLVFPSEFETWGLVVNEAMQFGLPVMASDRVGCRHDLIVEGQTGFTFPAGDADALSAIIQRMARDPAERNRMGKMAAEHIKGFSTEKSVAGIRNALDYLDMLQ